MLRLIALKAKYSGKVEATAYTWNFAAAWTGVHWRTAQDAMKELMGRGLVKCCEPMTCGNGRKLNTFLPAGVTADRHDFAGLGTMPTDPEPEPREIVDPVEIVDMTPIGAATDQADPDLIAVAATRGTADEYDAMNARKAELRKQYERLKREEVNVR